MTEAAVWQGIAILALVGLGIAALVVHLAVSRFLDVRAERDELLAAQSASNLNERKSA